MNTDTDKLYLIWKYIDSEIEEKYTKIHWYFHIMMDYDNTKIFELYSLSTLRAIYGDKSSLREKLLCW